VRLELEGADPLHCTHSKSTNEQNKRPLEMFGETSHGNKVLYAVKNRSACHPEVLKELGCLRIFV